MISNPFRTLTLSMALAVTWAGGAFAQQTAPDTLVRNTISLSYNSGDGTPIVNLPTVDDHTAEFRVDRKIDLLVDAQSSEGLRTAAPGETPVILPFFVRNLGNAQEGYIVTASGTGTIEEGGLEFANTAPSPGEYALVLTESYDPGTFDLSGATYYTPGDAAFNINPNLPVDEGYYVLIVANVPIEATNEQFDDFTVTVATATEPDGTTARTQDTRDPDPMSVSIILADSVSISSRTDAPIDDPDNGQAADETRLRIDAPDVTAEKALAVIDEGRSDYVCGTSTGTAVVETPPAFIPGACIEYTITISNASTAAVAATDISITDVLPNNVTHVLTTAGAFTVTEAGNPVTSITATLAELPVGATESFTIRVIID